MSKVLSKRPITIILSLWNIFPCSRKILESANLVPFAPNSSTLLLGHIHENTSFWSFMRLFPIKIRLCFGQTGMDQFFKERIGSKPGLQTITRFSLFFCVFPTSPSTVPSTHQQNCTKMAYNLPSKMMLYFMKCTHISYRYSITSILYHHEFSYDLIHSLMLFNHPYSKCAHLNVTHYGLKIYVNG